MIIKLYLARKDMNERAIDPVLLASINTERYGRDHVLPVIGTDGRTIDLYESSHESPDGILFAEVVDI